MAKDMKILIPKEDLQKKIVETAEKINEYYGKDEELNIICVLKGAVMFCTDLIKHLEMPVKLEFVSLSSYGYSEKSSGRVKAFDLTLPAFDDKNVLIVEDIIDTGNTIEFLSEYIKKNLNPKSLKVASFADKKCARINNCCPDFYCFDVDDKFIVGYGLDSKGLYRNLPYVAYFE